MSINGWRGGSSGEPSEPSEPPPDPALLGEMVTASTELDTDADLGMRTVKHNYSCNGISNNIESRHEISNNVVCATSIGSDQPPHTRSLIRASASRLNILRLLSY